MKRLIPCVVAIAAFAAAGDAAAFEFGTKEQRHPYRSSQHFALELRFGPYKPAVDDEPGLRGTPFADSFDTNARLYAGLEFDWQTFRIPYVGTIGPGLSVGTVSMSRRAKTKTNPPQDSGDDYGLTIYPMYLSAVLRGDVFWREAGVPLVPYGKVGIGYGIWRATSTGSTSKFGGISGRGGTWGTHFALGLGFPLDALDRGASRNMDNAVGINNTYFYAEYYWLTLNGIAQSKALYVGTASWVMGLAFEF